MADKITLKEGDVIMLEPTDSGGLLTWGNNVGWQLQPTYRHLGRTDIPDEPIRVGTDIPVELCQGLIDNGRCVMYVPPVLASPAKTVKPVPLPSAVSPTVPANVPAA